MNTSPTGSTPYSSNTYHQPKGSVSVNQEDASLGSMTDPLIKSTGNQQAQVLKGVTEEKESSLLARQISKENSPPNSQAIRDISDAGKQWAKIKQDANVVNH